MDKKKLYLILQSALCVVLAALLIAAVLALFFEGAAQKAEEPTAWIFTREKLAASLRPVLPLLLAALVLTGAGLVLEIRDEKGEKKAGNRTLPRDGSRQTAVAERRAERKKQKDRPSQAALLRAMLLVLAAVLILAGVFNGSAGDVFGKAVKICTECIGLG